MLTQEDDVDVHALHRQGWTISAIARHLGHDRKTIRAYVKGDRVAGQRVWTVPDPFEPFAAYCTQRLKDDPDVWASTLFDEVDQRHLRLQPLALRLGNPRHACLPKTCSHHEWQQAMPCDALRSK